MNHTKIPKKLLRYIDGDLSANEMTTVREHLAHCSLCREHLAALSNVWKFEGARERMRPSPYLWTRLQVRIAEYERNQHLFVDFFERLIQLARPAFVLLILVVPILLGIYLGNFPASSNTQSVKARSSSQDQERFFESLYLDSFRDLPPESLGGVYVTLASNEKGGAQ